MACFAFSSAVPCLYLPYLPYLPPCPTCPTCPYLPHLPAMTIRLLAVDIDGTLPRQPRPAARRAS